MGFQLGGGGFRWMLLLWAPKVAGELKGLAEQGRGATGLVVGFCFLNRPNCGTSGQAGQGRSFVASLRDGSATLDSPNLQLKRPI